MMTKNECIWNALYSIYTHLRNEKKEKVHENVQEKVYGSAVKNGRDRDKPRELYREWKLSKRIVIVQDRDPNGTRNEQK